jgi:hypothetical protein
VSVRLVQEAGVGEEEIARVNVLLNRLERGCRPHRGRTMSRRIERRSRRRKQTSQHLCGAEHDALPKNVLRGEVKPEANRRRLPGRRSVLSDLGTSGRTSSRRLAVPRPALRDHDRGSLCTIARTGHGTAAGEIRQQHDGVWGSVVVCAEHGCGQSRLM